MIYELLYCLEFRQQWVIDDDVGGISGTLPCRVGCLGVAYVPMGCNSIDRIFSLDQKRRNLYAYSQTPHMLQEMPTGP